MQSISPASTLSLRVRLVQVVPRGSSRELPSSPPATRGAPLALLRLAVQAWLNSVVWKELVSL